MIQRMRKLISYLLTALLMFAMIGAIPPTAVHATAANTFTDADSGLKFEVLTEDSGSGTVQVIKDSYSGTAYTVPETVSNGGTNYTVIGIGYEAFQNCSLSAIVLPDSITYIGNFAFEGRTNLSAVSIPNSVTEIGISAFAGTGLTSITIPSGVAIVGAYAFYGCAGLNSVIFLGISAPEFDAFAFQNTPLESVTVPVGTVAEYGSNLSGNLPAGATITAAAAAVTGVSVSPSAVEVVKGGTMTFSAIVSGTGSFSPAVVWSDSSASSYIGQTDGVLTVAIAESESAITIRATSLADQNVFGEATVTVKPSAPQEEFSLTVGSTCYFDLSSITTNSTSAAVNSALPDIERKWVPFTYVGTVNAYSLNANASGVTSASETAALSPSSRSLFLADYNIYLDISWQHLNDNYLIYGKNYSANGVSYLLRSLSAGSGNMTPPENEWDQILTKGDFLHNYSEGFSWGQDTYGSDASRRALRGYFRADTWFHANSTYCHNVSNGFLYGFRPALEILNAEALSSDALKAVTYNMGSNGTLGAGTLTSAAIVYTGELTLPEITEANGFNYTGAPQDGKLLGWYHGSDFYSAESKLSSLPNGTVLTAGYGVRVPTYSLTVTAGAGGRITGGSSGNYPAGTIVSIKAEPDSNYSFKGWTSTGGGTFGSAANAATTFTMPANAAAITAVFTNNGGGGGSGGGGKEPPKDPPKLETSGDTTTATTTAASTTDSNGKAAAAVTKDQLNAAVNSAVAEAGKQGNGTSAVVEIKVEAPANSNSVETGIPRESVGLAANSGADALKISTPVASISFDSDALSTIYGGASGDVRITAAKADTASLSPEAQQLVGDRPVYKFSVVSGNETISEFNGNVTVSVPYQPEAGEDLDAIVIYYINAEGNAEMVTNCKYDPVTKTVSFTTNHFSEYAVGYHKVGFGDVKTGAWYANAVEFAAARGIVSGTGNGNFSPDGTLTRGQLLVMLMRAYGMGPDTDLSNNFSDAGNTYYTEYLAAAKRLGITEGLGNNLYGPEANITRQEMFVLLYNTLKVMKELPEGETGAVGSAGTDETSLTAFTDADSVASWAKSGADALVNAGIISGTNGKLSPKNTTSRAEMAQVLYNLLTK